MLSKEEMQELHELVTCARNLAGDGIPASATLRRANALTKKLIAGLADSNVVALCDRAIASLPEKTYLYYVAQGDELFPEQIAFLLAGDMESLWDSTWEWEAEQVDASVARYLRDSELSDDEREALENSDEYERFREACMERDASDWLADIIRNTPAPMVRYDTGHDVAPEPWVVMSDDEIREEMRAIAETLGIDFDANRDALRSLVVEASYGGRLMILHRSDLDDVMKVTSGGTVTFTDPQVLVYDGFNGSGSMEQVTGTVTLTVDADTMRHDAGRMSWSDDIACIVHSACETPAKFTPKQI